MDRKQSGFTLIEIVMVLVLLGILSAVAAPKYFDLRDQAEKAAAKSAVAEYQARLNAEFAQQLLAGKSCTDSVADAFTALHGSSGAVVTMGNSWSVANLTSRTPGTSQQITVTAPSGTSYTDETDTGGFMITIPECAQASSSSGSANP